MKIRTATGLIRAYMRLFGFAGWTSFWNTVYVLPGRESDQRLLRHERCHLEQIQRDGRLVFAVKYLWWLLLHGYLDNPYERAARAAEDPPRGHA